MEEEGIFWGELSHFENESRECREFGRDVLRNEKGVSSFVGKPWWDSTSVVGESAKYALETGESAQSGPLDGMADGNKGYPREWGALNRTWRFGCGPLR